MKTKSKIRKEEKRMTNLINTILPIVCLSAGFYFGFKIGKTSEIPKVPKEFRHPIKTMQETKREEKVEEELNKAIRNLDNYDGTSLSQEDI